MPVYRGSGDREALYVGANERESAFVGMGQVFSAIPSQTFDMGNYIDLGEFNRFGWRISPRPLIDTDLVENGAEAYLHGIELNRGTGRVRLFTAPTATDEQGFAGPDLTTEIEDNGILTIEAGSQTLVLDGLGDTTEPYFWIPSNSAEVIAFANAVSVGTTGTLTISAP